MTPQQNGSSASNKITVLAVDDDHINLQVIQNYLKIAGITVKTAGSGREALRKLDAAHVDIVLLDIMMPDLNGYETARKIRQTYTKETLPIIFLTAKNRVNDLVVGFASGGNDYITKPILKDELLSRINFHAELARSRAALEQVRRRIDQLLTATKAISKAKTKVMACTTAIVHLLSILEKLKAEQADVFLP